MNARSWKRPLAGWAVAFTMTTAAAHAKVFDFSFADAAGDSASGQLTTGSGSSSYLISGISGTFDSSAITELSSYAGSDNDLFIPAPYVDYGGLSFTTAAGYDANVWSSGGTYYVGVSTFDPTGSGPNDRPLTTFAVTSVPESSTWAMMALGFAGLGFAGYRSSRKRYAFAE